MSGAQNSTTFVKKPSATLPNHSPKGRFGEETAAAYLKTQGYSILERNWHKQYAELDIVALDGDCLVFVEVKSRFGSDFDRPEEAMTPWKIRTLMRAAELYKLYHPDLPDFMRIDFVGIVFKNNNPIEINLIKNITG
jgi:putative endonuclease